MVYPNCLLRWFCGVQHPDIWPSFMSRKQYCQGYVSKECSKSTSTWLSGTNIRKSVRVFQLNKFTHLCPNLVKRHWRITKGQLLRRFKCFCMKDSAYKGYFFLTIPIKHFQYEKSIVSPSSRVRNKQRELSNSGWLSTVIKSTPEPIFSSNSGWYGRSFSRIIVSCSGDSLSPLVYQSEWSIVLARPLSGRISLRITSSQSTHLGTLCSSSDPSSSLSEGPKKTFSLPSPLGTYAGLSNSAGVIPSFSSIPLSLPVQQCILCWHRLNMEPEGNLSPIALTFELGLADDGNALARDGWFREDLLWKRSWLDVEATEV